LPFCGAGVEPFNLYRSHSSEVYTQNDFEHEEIHPSSNTRTLGGLSALGLPLKSTGLLSRQSGRAGTPGPQPLLCKQPLPGPAPSPEMSKSNSKMGACLLLEERPVSLHLAVTLYSWWGEDENHF
jgi:hypothetical protein